MFLKYICPVVRFLEREVSQKEKNKYRLVSLMCEIQKNDTDELICKTERDADLENGYMDTEEGGGGCSGSLKLTYIHPYVENR